MSVPTAPVSRAVVDVAGALLRPPAAACSVEEEGDARGREERGGRSLAPALSGTMDCCAEASPAWVPAVAGQPVCARKQATTLGPAGTKWYPGRATFADGSVDVAYDDGDIEPAARYIKESAKMPLASVGAGSANATEPMPFYSAPPVAGMVPPEPPRVTSASASDPASANDLVSISRVASVTASDPASANDLVSISPSVTVDTWVECDACGKWRRLFAPPGVQAEFEASLPETWYCALSSDPKRNDCAAPEQDEFEEPSPPPSPQPQPSSSIATVAAPVGASQALGKRKIVASQALGKRKIVPTMVKVGNHYVKRQNMYDMEEGERSVFAGEYDGTRDAAFAPRDRPVHPPAGSVPLPRPPPVPKQKSESESRRLANNERVRAEAAMLAGRRAQFFHAHRSALAPFVGEAVLASFAAAAAAAPPPLSKRSLLSQPDVISGGEMRDYQLVGLDWMVDRIDRHGLSPILGDEVSSAPLSSTAMCAPGALAPLRAPTRYPACALAPHPPRPVADGPGQDTADDLGHRPPQVYSKPAGRSTSGELSSAPLAPPPPSLPLLAARSGAFSSLLHVCRGLPSRRSALFQYCPRGALSFGGGARSCASSSCTHPTRRNASACAASCSMVSVSTRATPRESTSS